MKFKYNHPLMHNNVEKEDMDAVVKYIQQDPIPILSNLSIKIDEFENKWTEWLGCKHSLMVSSGAIANELTMMGLRYMFGKGAEILVPALSWSSDWYSIIRNGLVPITCDINLNNLSFNLKELKEKITPKTKAIFVTHVLGLNALSLELLRLCEENNLLLIEDVCESHGATFMGRKLGTFGFASNFSLYQAHHITTGSEGGIICCNNEKFYDIMRCARSHSMLRESRDSNFKKDMIEKYPNVNPDFMFLFPGYNARSNAINAIVATEQIKRLDSNNQKRIANFEYFIKHLDGTKYFKDFSMNGQCNYAFILILKEFNREKWAKVELALKENSIEMRRGCSGGGSMLYQPFYLEYLKENNLPPTDQSRFPILNHIHFCSAYIGNYPTLEKSKIDNLLRILNSLNV